MLSGSRLVNFPERHCSYPQRNREHFCAWAGTSQLEQRHSDSLASSTAPNPALDMDKQELEKHDVQIAKSQQILLHLALVFWLKTIGSYCLAVLEASRLKSRCLQGILLEKLLEEDPSWLFKFLVPQAFLGLQLQHVSLHFHCYKVLSPYVCIFAWPSSPLIRTLGILD